MPDKNTEKNDETPEIEAKAPENILTKEIRDKLKDKFQDIQLSICGERQYVYRLMGRKEYETMANAKKMQGEEAEENIVKAMLVWPAWNDVEWEKYSGDINTLSNDILLFAGFGHKIDPITL